MLSKTLRYRTDQRLALFIKENYTKEDVLLIQIFTPSKSKELLLHITKYIKNLLPNSTIIATTSVKNILNSTIGEGIIINFISRVDFEVKYYQNYHNCLKELKEDFFYLLYAVDFDRDGFKSEKKKLNLVASFYNDFILYENKILFEGGVVVSFKDLDSFDIRVCDFIQPIGRELKITKSKRNLLTKVENFTITKLYSHYLGEEFFKDLKEASFTFPLLLKDTNGYRASLILKTSSNSAVLDTKVDRYKKIRLGFSKSSKFYEKYIDMIKSFDLNKSSFVFILSSTARATFFEKNGFEYDLGVGIFSDSEFAIVDGKVYDTNLSVIVVNFKKDPKDLLKLKRHQKNLLLKDDITLDALSNIAKISSDELEELNQELEKKVAIEVEKNLKKDAILIHRSRLAQMGEMISLIAHQWKQPLSAISATSSGLQVRAELDRYDKDFFINSLLKIENFVNHLSNTIDDFSNFFKPSKQKKEFILEDAILKALNIATYSLTKNSIKIEKNIQKDIKLNTYENELIQVLLNLIKNAENILIKREIKDPKIIINAKKVDNKVIIEVIDNGGGVEKEIIDKIFEPYFSTKATKDSTGLGLYMSKFIVENSLLGELKLKNEKEGTNFSITLV